jgi:hypothetical protein
VGWTKAKLIAASGKRADSRRRAKVTASADELARISTSEQAFVPALLPAE